jgi:polysaccharide biosynthesis transport protein
MRAILDWAKSVFDLVIVDSPEVGNRVDSIILTKHSDLVLFVVKWSSTPADIVAECLGKLDESKIRGVAINAVNEHEAASYGDSNARFARLQGQARPAWRGLRRV